jgi:predicted PurR-regulated permease PerM
MCAWTDELVPLAPCAILPPTARAMKTSTTPWQALFFKLLLIGSGLSVLLWLTIRLKVVTTPILIGFFIAYALNPAVRRLRAWRVPGFLALTVPVLLVVGLSVLFATVVVPSLAQEFIAASQHAPARIYNLVLKVDPWFKDTFGKNLSSFVHYSNLSGMMQSLAVELFGPARSLLGWVLTSVRDVAVALGNLVLVVIVAFFLLDDYERIVKILATLVPRREVTDVTRVVRRIDEVLAGFLRGELALLIAATVVFTLGLALLDVPFFPVVGPTVGVIYLVPYVGVLAGAVVCMLLSLLTNHSLLQVLGVVALFGAFYTVDLVFITPRVIGNKVGLKPLTVLLGIIAMGELFGLIGVLIAIPLLACGRILLLEAVERYQQSAVYLALPDAPAVDESPPREGPS